jgi:diguanylate cyclase (GGDEF)-like protein/PAS domain S-box-containing protein
MFGNDPDLKKLIQQQTLELRASEARFHNIVSISTDGIVIVDGSGMILFVNPAAESLFGRTAKELLGEPFGFPIVAGETTELDIANREGKRTIAEMRVAGTEWEGKPAYLATLRDITVRKQAETEIQKSEMKFSQIFNSVPALIAISTLNEGRFIDVNQTCLQTLAYQREEIIGKTARELGLWEDEPALIRTMEEQGSIRNLEVRFKGKTGQSFIGLYSADLIEINGDKYMLTVVRDITERKRLETEIQDAREYAENIVETVREPLVVLDSDLKILTANLSFYDTFKVTPGETIGNFIYDLGNRQWDIPKLRVLFEEILPHDTVFNGYEVEHDFQGIGRKIILLNARQIFRKNIGSHIILLAMEDITERKRVEAALQISEKKFSDVFHSVPALIGISTIKEGKFIEVNQTYLQTLGYLREEIIGKTAHEIGLWEDESERVEVTRTLQEQGSIRNVEVRFKVKTGHSLIGLLSAELIDINGEWRMLSIVRDITERKQLETEIQDAREYAENIVETVREPLVVLNSDLKILTANLSFYDTFKVAPEETIGNFIYDLGNRQWDIPKLRVLVEEILPHDTVINGYEVEHIFQDIGRKTILLNARQIFRENIGSHIILLAMEDITERKLAEERISEVIRQQQAILDNIPNIAWLKDRNGRYVAVNDPFGKALGVASGDLVGKNDFDIYPPELAEKYEKEFREVMAAGARVYFEESTEDREGKIKYVEKIKTPIFNDMGAVIGVIGIVHDITNLKETEVSLRHESTHDILTGLYNRAFFDEELERLAHGRMFPVSIVMADINGLKTVNDTLGHEAGDNLIKLAAGLILEAFRAEDIVARIGGDEFAVLLPGTDDTVAEKAVKRIMSSPEIIAGRVSIAFGIASAENKDQLAETLKLSDERMYLDKSAQKEPQAEGDTHGEHR